MTTANGILDTAALAEITSNKDGLISVMEAAQGLLELQRSLGHFNSLTYLERAHAEAFMRRPPQSFPAIADVVPVLVGIAVRKFLDTVDGNDANTGDSHAQAKKTYQNAIGSGAAAGTTLFIANDSLIEYGQTFANYKASPAFGDNNIGFANGTASQPIVIRPYYPRRNSSAMPTFRWYAQMQAGDWTQESGYGGKVWSAPYTGLGGAPWRNVCFLFGSAQTPGVAPGHDSNGPAVLAKAYDYAADSAKVYVYVPDGTNPNTYYGSVRCIGGTKALMSAFGRISARLMGLYFDGVYAVKIQDFGSTSLTSSDLEIFGCKFTKCIRALQYDNRQTFGTPRENNLVFRDCDIEDALYPQVQLVTAGTSGNTISYELYRNRLRRGNLSQSYGGALLYTQALGGTKRDAWGNYGYDCRNGTGDCEIDGSFIYADIGASKVRVYGNIMERCGVGLQSNLATDVWFISNLFIDCGSAIQSTEATAASQPSTHSVHQLHNLWVWTGRISMADLPVGKNIGGTDVKDWTKHPVYVINNQNGNAGGPNYAAVTFVNNGAINESGTDFPDKPLLEFASAKTTTLLIDGNAAKGIGSALLLRDKDSAGDKANLAGYLAVIGAVNDNKPWLRNPLAGDCRPSLDSPLIGRGSSLSQQYADIAGRNFAARPTIGCFEALAA